MSEENNEKEVEVTASAEASAETAVQVKPKKKKMRNLTFNLIWIPTLTLLTGILVAGNIVCNYFAESLDYQLGGVSTSVSSGESDVSDELKDYYGINGMTMEEAVENSSSVLRQVTDEGTILLKNNGVLPLEKSSEVTPFGYGYLNPFYTGLGAGTSSSSDTVTPEAGLSSYFTVNSSAANAMKGSSYESPKEADGTTSVGGSQGTTLSTDQEIREYNPDIYSSLTGLSGSTGIVYITRTGQEGADKKYDAYEDGTPHHLALSKNERETITYAKEHCKSVVVVIVSSNIMECGDLMEGGELEVDAVLSVGNPGQYGFDSLGRILCGEVNPSGRTVDTWARDFTADPTYQNFGEFSYSNATWGGSNRYFIEYEEDVYLGYKYYETAAYMDSNFDYDEAVVYPFGYGLSYCDLDGGFSQEITSMDYDDTSVTLTVNVTNNSNTYSGKDVVEVYYSAPYTDFDVEYKIEKPVVNLIDFEKTDILAPGESQEIKVSFDLEDMASYCYTRSNSDGTTGAYVLESGNYSISIRANSHDVLDSETLTLNDTVWYDSTNPRESDKEAQADRIENEGGQVQAASNCFETSNDYMNECATILSRSDWEGTQPSMPENRTAQLPEDYVALNDASCNFDYSTDSELGNVSSSKVYTTTTPTYGEDNGMTLLDMRGKSFYDSDWDLLLDQLDFDNNMTQIRQFIGRANCSLGALDDVGKEVSSLYSDGATGVTSASGSSSMASTPVFAATWNKDLMYEAGVCVGTEASVGGVSGWYSPAMNIHRSPFSGRNYEYFSEDGVLSGKMAAGIVSGAASKGVSCFIKHFFLNDEETNRSNWLAAWASEQAMRELYLKPFEICIKESEKMTVKYLEQNEEGEWEQKEAELPSCSAMMVSQACVGFENCMCDYEMLTDLVRGEWGFEGTISTDMYYGDSWICDKFLRAGGDIYLGNCLPKDYKSATGLTCIRNAVKHALYTTVNTSFYQGVAPSDKMTQSSSWWRPALIALDVCLGAFIVGWAGFLVYRNIDGHRNPDKYKGKKN